MTKADSDLSRVKRWWRTLGDETFLAVSPPTRDRYTQSELHEDAGEEIEQAGLPEQISYAGWHWQSHERAFGPGGTLIGPLLLHWSGELAIVAAHLQDPPEGFWISGGEPDTAFTLDRVPVLGPDGLADPDDPPSVRQLLAHLDEPISRSTLPFRYPPLSEAEAAWLRARIAQSPDLESAAPFVLQLARRDGFTEAELFDLLPRWQDEFDPLIDWEPWSEVLHNLLQLAPVQHWQPSVWELIDRIGPAAAEVLTDFPDPVVLQRVASWGRDQIRSVTPEWLSLQMALEQQDVFAAAEAIAAEVGDDPALAAAMVTLLDAQEINSGEQIPQAALVVATDQRLSLPLRRAAAQLAVARLPFTLESLADRQDAAALSARERIRSFEEARSELLADARPDLTQYQGGLAEAYDDFREVTAGAEQWLHDQVADPTTGMQGIAFCLEILLSQGRGTAADVDALAGRWRKELAKKYDTTYAEWRHPMVTLTALATQLEHPLAEALESWWARSSTPKWATELIPLTMIGAPDQESTDLLWRVLSVTDPTPGQWRTWLLMRGQLDGRRPVEIAAELLEDSSITHPDQVITAMIATADARLPLWRYAFSESSPAWLERALEVAEDGSLNHTARTAAARTAGQHRMFSHPESVSPVPTAEQVEGFIQRLNALGQGD